MKKFLILMLIFVAALLFAAKIKYIGTQELRIMRSGGKKAPAEAKIYDKNLMQNVYELDGKSILILPQKKSGAQTVRVLACFPTQPAGVVISRHRAEEGHRGFEVAFTGMNIWHIDGQRLALFTSGGGKDTANAHSATSEVIQPANYIEFVLRFFPNKKIQVDAFDRATGRHLQGVAIEVNYSKIAAGQPILAIGGQRVGNTRIAHTVPAGTRIAAVTVWDDKALSDTELAKELKLNQPATPLFLSIPPAPKPSTPEVKQRILYVNAATGNDNNTGLSWARAFRTLQRAADEVNSGDIVYVAKGVYQPIKITRPGLPGHPIVFRTEQPGISDVVISCADRKILSGVTKWHCEDLKNRLYSVDFDHQPARITVDNLDLFAGPPSLECLKQGTMLHGFPAPDHGYFFDATAKKLYVRLHPSVDPNPNNHRIAVGAPYAPGSSGQEINHPDHACVFINAGTDAHIILDGFTFEVPGGAGICTRSGSVAVRNAKFLGCRFGVWGVKVSRIFVENCLYTQSPVFMDYLDIINRYEGTEAAKKFRFYFWAHKRLKEYSNMTNFNNYETGVLGGDVADGHIRNCKIDDSFEGNSANGDRRLKKVRVYGNVFSRLIDNAFECENHIPDIRFHDNLIENVFEPISWQPLDGEPWPGPAFFYRNIVRDGGKHAIRSFWKMGTFKIGAQPRNWGLKTMIGRPHDRAAAGGVGFWAWNNTVIRPENFFLTAPQSPKVKLINFHFYNNVFYVSDCLKRPWFCTNWDFGGNTEILTGTEAQRGILSANGGKEIKSFKQLGIAGDGVGIPKEGSPLRGAAASLPLDEIDVSPDVGVFAADMPAPTSDWPGHVGPGNGVDLGKMSLFAYRAHFWPDVLRTPGPEYGTWGIYSLNETPDVIPATAGTTLKIVFRAAARKDGEYALATNGNRKIFLSRVNGVWSLRFEDNGKTIGAAILGKVSPLRWQTTHISCKNSTITIALAGEKPITIAADWWSPEIWQVIIGKNPVFDFTAE